MSTKSCLDKFLDGELVLSIDKDREFLPEIHQIVVDSGINPSPTIEENLYDVSLHYNADEIICLSFNFYNRNGFGHGRKGFYLAKGFEVMSIKDFLAACRKEPRATKTEWMTMLE